MATFTMEYQDAILAEPGIETTALVEYPIFDEAYRVTLNKHIYDQFRHREIGMETASMFELALRRKMNQIMPVYNQHYLISLQAAGVDPLQTMSMKNSSATKGNTSSTGESTNKSNSDAKSRAVASEFPQQRLAGNKDYATNAQDNISDSQANGSGTEKSNLVQDGKTDGTVTGSQGQTSMLLFQHRQTLVNVDLMVLNELEELFMAVWSNGDEFTPRGYGVRYYGNATY